MNPNIVPIVAIFAHTDTVKKTYSPGAQLLNKTKDVKFSPIFVAAACVAVYECFERHVAESEQNDFELLFQTLFVELFKQRAEFMNFLPAEEIDDGY